MLYQFVLNLLAVFLFLYIFWQKLREDYLSSQIFTTSFYVLIAVGVSTFIAAKFFPLGWFWLGLLATFLGLCFGVRRFHLRFYETLEAFIVAMFPWLGIIFLIDAIKNLSWFSLGGSICIWLVIGFYYYLNKKYKHFSWYRSGRVGFAGLSTLGIFFLVRSTFAVFFPFMLSFLGKLDSLLSAALSFIIFLAVYNLAKQV